MAGNTTIEQNKLKALGMRDRAANPWLPYYIPSERYEVMFADVRTTDGASRAVGVFSHANGMWGADGKKHSQMIREWAESVGVEHMGLGVASAYFASADDQMLCLLAFS